MDSLLASTYIESSTANQANATTMKGKIDAGTGVGRALLDARSSR